MSIVGRGHPEIEVAVKALVADMVRNPHSPGTRRAGYLLENVPPDARWRMAQAWLVDEARARLRLLALHEEKAAERSLYEMRDPVRRAEKRKAPANRSGQWLEELSEEKRQEYFAALRKISQRHQAKVASIMEDWKQELHIEWTRELLDSTFALPDGSRVPWGEATVEQHQERVAMLMRSAVGTLETATRHEKAIETITKAEVICLNELEGAAA